MLSVENYQNMSEKPESSLPSSINDPYQVKIDVPNIFESKVKVKVDVNGETQFNNDKKLNYILLNDEENILKQITPNELI